MILQVLRARAAGLSRAPGAAFAKRVVQRIAPTKKRLSTLSATGSPEERYATPIQVMHWVMGTGESRGSESKPL